MNKWFLLPSFLFLICCKGEEPNTFFTADKALKTFSGIEDLCNRDNGKLWGENLYGPLMYVERTSRRIFANYPDNEGLLKEKDGIYTGFYPRELILSNAPVKFGGTMFALTPLPAEDDKYRLITRGIHSLFHRYQESVGFRSSGFNTSNMDEKEARVWIKLEWKALRKALNSEGEDKLVAIRDALIFRGANRELYGKYAIEENRFETYEGLTTFTYTMLFTNSKEEYKKVLFQNLDRTYALQSYSKSYGSVHGALYSSLLYEKGFNINSIKTEDFDLGKAVKTLYSIELPEICRDVAGSLAMNYDIDLINREEEKRLADIKESIHKQISTFTEKPVVFLEFESPYFDFEPEDIHPLDTLGTLYTSMRVSDNWGKLTVEKGGCLVSENYKFLRITAKGFKTEKSRISGEGWQLILNEGWELVEVDQNYFIRMLMP
jgi:hypothetical protein